MCNVFSLEGKRILVTGASSGLGKAAAQVFAKAGAQVVLVARNIERLTAVKDSLSGSGHTVFPMDLSDTDAIPKAIKTYCKDTGALNGVFHAAGIECIKPINIIKESSISETFSASINATLMIAKAFTMMGVKADTGASLVFMSSVASITGKKGLSVYSASKGAVDAAARSLASEFADKQLRVNTIVSGAVITEMHDRLTGDLPLESIKDYEGKHLLGFGEPSDIANAALYLLSDASKWVTGTSLVVDGGYSCQ